MAAVGSVLRATPAVAALTVAACPEPGSRQIVLYTDTAFFGTCEVFYLGQAVSLENNEIRDNTVSSVDVGSDVTLAIYKDPDFGCPVEYFSD